MKDLFFIVFLNIKLKTKLSLKENIEKKKNRNKEASIKEPISFQLAIINHVIG